MTTIRPAMLALLLVALLGACVTAPMATGPQSLSEAAAMAPAGPRRASIQLSDQAASALDRGETDNARAAASRALRVDQGNPYAYYVITRIALAEGDLLAAERDLSQALHLLELQEPGNLRWRGRMLRLRARLMADRGRDDDARRLRAEADRLDPASSSGAPPGHVIETPR